MREGLGNLRYPKGRGLSKGNGKGGKIWGGGVPKRGVTKFEGGSPKLEGGSLNLKGGVLNGLGTLGCAKGRG